MIDGTVSGDNDHEGVIEAISKRKAEDLVQIIRSGIHDSGYAKSGIQSSAASASHQPTNSTNSSSSIADELTKLGKLRDQGIITEEEFTKLKKDVLDRMMRTSQGLKRDQTINGKNIIDYNV